MVQFKIFLCLAISGVLVTLAIGCKASLDEFLKQNKDGEIEVDRWCRFRNFTELYPANELWRYLTGAYCYSFTQPSRLAHRIALQHQWFDNVWVPFIVFEGSQLAFDYTQERSTALIRRLFLNERFFYLWMECAQAGNECCHEHLDATNAFPNEDYVCPASWDGWDCWPMGRANQTLRRTCPRHTYTSEDIVCILESERYCLKDDWDHRTNYDICATAPILRRRHSFHVYVLIASTVFAFPAVVIFLVFMRGHKDLRHALYSCLLIAIVLKNIVTIVSKEIIILDALRSYDETLGTMDNNTLGCRVLTFFNHFFTNAVFMFMLLVGYYLHSTIARIFGKGVSPIAMYLLAFVGAFAPALDWALAMNAAQQENCWVIDRDGFHWINDVYRFGVLIANFILLMDIIRVICTQRSKLNAKQTKAAAKAILVLIPLFGVPLLLTSQRGIIDQDDCLAGDIYYYVAYSVEALQGIIVALIFCYLSKEVHVEIKKWYRRFVIGINERFGTNFTVPMQPRVTTITNFRSSVLDNGPAYRNDSKASIRS